jgi:hypothetical protein
MPVPRIFFMHSINAARQSFTYQGEAGRTVIGECTGADRETECGRKPSANSLELARLADAFKSP